YRPHPRPCLRGGAGSPDRFLACPRRAWPPHPGAPRPRRTAPRRAPGFSGPCRRRLVRAWVEAPCRVPPRASDESARARRFRYAPAAACRSEPAVPDPALAAARCRTEMLRRPRPKSEEGLFASWIIPFSNGPQQLPGMPHAHFQVFTLLPAWVFSRWRRNRRSRLPALRQREKAAELPGRHLAIVVPELGIEDAKYAGLSRNQVLKNERNAGSHRHKLLDPPVDVHIAVTHVHPSHRNTLRHAPQCAVPEVRGFGIGPQHLQRHVRIFQHPHGVG